MRVQTTPMILVIDADPISLTAISSMLLSQRYQVLSASDGPSALLAAKCNSLDLVVCDVNLRGADGLDVVEQIRCLPEQADVPVLFLSSAQVSDVAYRNVGASSAYFLKKPATAQVLLDLVEKSLWMPHLIRSQMHRPHLPIGLSMPQTGDISASVG